MSKNNDRGAEAVEFALVVPIFLLLVAGIIHFGYAYYVQAGISGAARQAARTLATKGDATAATKAAQDAAPVALTVDAVKIEVDNDDSASNCVTGKNVTVTISQHVQSPVGLFGDLNLTGKGGMRCGG